MSDVPAVLSIALPSVVHPSPGVWMHHLELRGIGDVDDNVCGWLLEGYTHAG
jgi:hypothetical protein